MERLGFCNILIFVCELGAVSCASAQDLDTAVGRFWGASLDEVDAVIREIRDTDASFDEVYAGLQGIERYDGDVPTGRVELVRKNADGTSHRYFFVVPESYNPTTAYPVRVYLHGGVRRPEPDAGGGWWRQPDRLIQDDEIAVFPSAWGGAPWWVAGQVENLGGILRQLKATYHIDDNRVYLFGVSDGGTGAYFQAFKSATPWAAFVPMIGHPSVLANPAIGADDEVYPVNLSNRPFYVLNGETDRLYPVRSMVPWVRFFEGRNVDITFRPVNSGHTVEWWPEEAPAIERFILSKVRDPYPDRLIWETERSDRYNRLHWLVIDELGPPGSQPPEVPNDPFPHSRPSGRIEAERHGNDVIVEVRGIARFSLLFSPEEFDFDAPVTVTVNGLERFRGMLERDVDVLLHWAAVDRDRTMLYGASLQITVP